MPRAPRRCTWLVTVALACAGPRTVAPRAERPSPDCDVLRDDTVRACVAGFQRRSDRLEDPEAAELELAVAEVCPYAGAVAWSGCHRGAFRRFESRSELGACGDRGDYVEAAIQTSCMRPFDMPQRRWNDLVRECFEWAEAGSDEYRSSCLARPVG